MVIIRALTLYLFRSGLFNIMLNTDLPKISVLSPMYDVFCTTDNVCIKISDILEISDMRTYEYGSITKKGLKFDQKSYRTASS